MSRMKISVSTIFAILFMLIGSLNIIYIHKTSKLPVSAFKWMSKNSELPADDIFKNKHDLQWWYWTGHLETVEEEEKKEFSFELIFFTSNSLGIFKHQLAHAAIIDMSGNKHHYRKEVDFLNLIKKIRRGFNLSINKNSEIVMSAKGENDENEIYAEINNFIFELEFEEMDLPVIYSSGEKRSNSLGAYTYYYSRKKMEASGHIEIDGKEYEVEGFACFDKQYGNFYSTIFKGCQWFALTMCKGSNNLLDDFLNKYKEEKYKINETNSLILGNYNMKNSEICFNQTLSTEKYWRKHKKLIFRPASSVPLFS